MKTLDRYLLRMMPLPFLGSVAVFTMILLLDQIVKLLDLVLKKGVPLLVVLEILLYSLPFILALTIPMAVLVGTLLVFGRLAADLEILALNAAGISLRRILHAPLLWGIFLAAGMAVFNDRILPEANHRLKNLLMDVHQKRPAAQIRPGVFVRIGEVNLYSEEVDERTQRLKRVVVEVPLPGEGLRVVLADSGRFYTLPDEAIFLDLFHGSIYETDVDFPERLREVRFGHYRIRIDLDTRLIHRERAYRGDREKTTAMLLQEIRENREKMASAPESVREIHRRRIAQLLVEVHKKYALAVACLVFVLLGAPLAVRLRRGGFGTAFGVAFFVFVVYYVLLISGEELGDRMLVPPAVGMWWANALFFSLALWLLYRDS